jgi:16S rRNA (guanine527-N7)-methyltransferase
VSPREFRQRLHRRARRASVKVSDDQALHLEGYFRLLALWNRKINLTAFALEDPSDEAFDRLLIEPLAAAKHLPNGALSLIDIGSGSGSPAIPIRIARPHLQVRMVESKTRKSVFLREVIRQLQLEHVVIETARFEQLLARPELHEAFDVMTIRAVRVEGRTLVSLQAFLRPNGHVVWFRGSADQDSEATKDPIYPLTFKASLQLAESLRSRLVILEKQTPRR